MRFFAFIFIISISISFALAQDTKEFPEKVQNLLEKIKSHDTERYRFAFEKGAKVFPTADGNSFYLLWYPPNAKADKTMIVTMHGSNGNTFNEFYLWYDEAKKHGHGILALQWYFEGNPPPKDYYAPNEAYRELDKALKKEGIKPQKSLFHGFSRGSANSYYVTIFDRDSKNNYFLVTLSNSGGASEGYPIYRDIIAGKFGEKPFAGTNWITFCGANDPNPDRDGCPAMRRTGEFIKKYGGTVKLAMEDKNGDHGGFHRNKQNIKTALDLFDELLKTQ
ncbi:MAG TPA: hypothetical protein PKY82_07800 [Pyrinomonadaceae bacterium]|nr:hypothetical protein [Pyrinomonadaceae bacterium]